ncbi:MAG: transposase zinc-binding domain-containing protein [Armatimonadetes bacterium]|nr:transposase zinc-binding domain-containing protein [Armatimonadota bacterium]
MYTIINYASIFLKNIWGISVGETMARIKGEYHPRNPRASPLYQLVEDYWEDFVECYEERYEKTYGYFRDLIRKAFFGFLDCGDLRHGFARIHCSHCEQDMLLAFSCKTRLLCPSCSKKRALTFSIHLEEEVLDWTSSPS